MLGCGRGGVKPSVIPPDRPTVGTAPPSKVRPATGPAWMEKSPNLRLLHRQPDTGRKPLG